MTKQASKNYTKEQTAELVAAYTAAEGESDREVVVAEFAEKFGKTVGSVRAKLVSEEVYVAKTKTAGKRTKKKAELVTELANTLDLDEDVVGSLEKATAVALTKVITAVNSLKA